MLPSTLEWHAGAVLVGLGAFFWWPIGLLAAGMLVLSFLVAALQATQARLAPEHDGFRSRCLIAALCYLQPLVRSWARYRTRLFSYRPPVADPELIKDGCERLPLGGSRTAAYWTENGYERTELLGLFIAHLMEHRWGLAVDSGWSDWDVEVYCHPWTVVQVTTAQEEHGSGKRLIRVRYRLRLSGSSRALGATAFLLGLAAAWFQFWPAALGSLALLVVCAGMWWRGTCRAAQPAAIFDAMAGAMNLVRCEADGGRAAGYSPAVDTAEINPVTRQHTAGEA